VLTYERFEADDVIGTLAMQAKQAGFEVALVTGDKDFFQLVGDGVRVFNPRDEGTWYDAAGVVEKFGVRPDQVVDVLALMGDSVDNIKGVPGIGEKGARELIATHGTLDKLLEAAPSIAQKRHREGLLAHADDARMSRELARIRTDVPVTFDADALRLQGAVAGPVLQAVFGVGFPDARHRVRAVGGHQYAEVPRGRVNG
jgi:DNA polymerase-1